MTLFLMINFLLLFIDCAAGEETQKKQYNCPSEDNIIATIAQYLDGQLITMPPSKKKFDPIAYTHDEKSIISSHQLGPRDHRIGIKNIENQTEYRLLAVKGGDKPAAIAYVPDFGENHPSRVYSLSPDGMLWEHNMAHTKDFNYWQFAFWGPDVHDRSKKFGLVLNIELDGFQSHLLRLSCLHDGRGITRLRYPHETCWRSGYHEKPAGAPKNRKEFDQLLQSDEIDDEQGHVQQVNINGFWHLYKSSKSYPGAALFEAIRQGLEGRISIQSDQDQEEIFV